MGDVGDVDPQLVEIPVFVEADPVVQVLGVRAVNGEDPLGAQVLPARQLPAGKAPVGQGPGFVQDRRRELRGNPPGFQNGLAAHRRPVRRAEALEDADLVVPVALSPPDDLR